jgi:hypothetical protein
MPEKPTIWFRVGALGHMVSVHLAAGIRYPGSEWVIPVWWSPSKNFGLLDSDKLLWLVILCAVVAWLQRGPQRLSIWNLPGLQFICFFPWMYLFFVINYNCANSSFHWVLWVRLVNYLTWRWYANTPNLHVVSEIRTVLCHLCFSSLANSKKLLENLGCSHWSLVAKP